jgi:hypothetical protein
LDLTHQVVHPAGGVGQGLEALGDLDPVFRAAQTAAGEAGEEAFLEALVQTGRGVGESLQLVFELVVGVGELGAAVLFLVEEVAVGLSQLLALGDQLVADAAQLFVGQLAGEGDGWGGLWRRLLRCRPGLGRVRLLGR